MITLALQIFLLLLSAYLAGCMVGCMLRRALHEPKMVPVAVPVEATPRAPLSPETTRFETALTGKPLPPQPIAAPGEPVVEVRPRPAQQPVARDGGTAEIEIKKAPVAPPQPEPEPQPEAVVEGAPEPEPAPAPEPAAAEPHPEPVVAEQESLPPPPPPPPPMSGAAQMASYAAVAAAAAAARAIAAADAAAAAKAAEPEPEPEPEPDLEPELVAIEEPAVAFEAEPVVDVPAAPEPEVAPPVAAEPALPPEDLKRIRGIERELEERLNALGVRRFSDIASWSAGDVTRVSQTLGLLGRIEQENWIEQAQILARGADTDYSRRQRVAATTSAVGMAAAAASAAANATAQKSAGPDRFTRIIGVDADTEKVLFGLGYSRYSEIAKWTSADVERVESAIGRPGRVGLDNWIEQARVLARYAGDATEPRPVRLADAIRENKSQKAAEPVSRPDMAGLRSVRSQALRGDGSALGGRIDDLKRVRGIGVLIEKRLNALGISSYEQIANWTKADIDSVSSQLDFKGRIERENWIEQARILASGGQTEFSRRVDRGEVETSKDN
jgi:predicted flap endonuclease-1-like 5' DNA nuclease